MSNQDTKPYNVTITKLPQSMVEIKISIPWEEVATFEQKAFKRLAEHLELDGFRKGSVPESVAKKHIPDDLLLGDMAEEAINAIYPTILKEESLDIVGRPEVSITKIVRTNPLELTIRAAIVPPITLPAYKKIATAVPQEPVKDVTDEDTDKVIEDLRQLRAYGHVHGEGDAHEHAEELPEINDEFAKSFGNFQTVAELRAKVKENIMLEAEQNAKEKRRIKILEAIIAETSFELPEIILQSEVDKMIAQIEADVTRSGASLDDYLGHIKKTREELAEEFKPEADKRARFQLVLNAIAREMQILPTEEEVELEAQKLMARFPGADLNRTKAYADMMLTNDKTLTTLEELK